jgi:acyl carrier protein
MEATNNVETKIREFLKNEFAMSTMDYFGESDELNLDSLVQVELRLFLSREFNVKTDLSSMPIELTQSLANIRDYVALNS